MTIIKLCNNDNYNDIMMIMIMIMITIMIIIKLNLQLVLKKASEELRTSSSFTVVSVSKPNR